MSEQAEWTSALGGNGAAFGMLFDRHQQRIYRHACRLLDNAHDAEDVTASAFLELWRRRTTVRIVDGSVLPWLLVTTTNLARNVRRGTQRHRDFLDRLTRERTKPGAIEPSEPDPWTDVDDALASSLRSLPAQDLRLLTLVVWEGYSIADSAAVLGLTPAAAKSRLHRARTRLRAAAPDYLLPNDLQTGAPR